MIHVSTSADINTPESRRSRIINKILRYIMLTLALIVAGVYVYGQFILKAPSNFDTRCEAYTGEWLRYLDGGTVESYVAPFSMKTNLGEPVELYTTLPSEIPEDTYMFLRGSQDFKIFIDGEERAYFHLSKSTFPGKNVKGYWVPFKLTPDDAGKTLMFYRSNTVYTFSGMTTVFIGTLGGFFKEMLSENAIILLMAISIVLFSFIISIVCIVIRAIRHRSFPLMYLCIGVFATGFWLILDSYAYPLLFSNRYVDGVVEFMLTNLIPFPFIAYLNHLQKKRYQKFYNILNSILAFNTIFFSVLHFTGICDFDSSMTFMNIVLTVIILAASATLVRDTFIKRIRDYYLISIGYALLLVFAITEIIHVNLPVHTNDGMFVAMGLISTLSFSIVHELRSLKKLQEQTIEATESNRAKSTFLANMSHEIRTPINAIMGMNELILRENSSESIKEYSENIKNASKSLLEIINDILDFSKIEQGKMEIIEENYSICDVLLGVTAMIKIKADEKGLRLSKEISKDIPTVLCGDSKRITEIMINLLNNSVKYTKKGTVTLNVSAEPTGDDTCNLVIKVKDTGIGIREEDKDKLFKQFERLDYVKNKSIEGSGLGLAITGNLTKLMSGTIECNSAYDVGTEFIVTIPQTIIDRTPIGNIDEHHLSADENDGFSGGDFICPSARVLIVDDNEMNLKVAAGLIETTKALVKTCQSGFEMLDIVTREEFDIILLDHMMPDMDGIETLRAAVALENNKNLDTPVIALTANAIVGAREMYLKNGFTDYLSKPMDVPHLTKLLRTYLPESKITNINESVFAHPAKHNTYNSNLIDRQAGMRYCGGLEDFYHDALKLYVETLPEKKAILACHYEKKDFANYEVLVHSMKSNSLTIGANDLSNMARELENACKNGDYEFVENNHYRFEEMIDVVREEAIKMLK